MPGGLDEPDAKLRPIRIGYRGIRPQRGEVPSRVKRRRRIGAFRVGGRGAW